MNKPLFGALLTAGMVVALAGCTSPSESNQCIEVVVDYGILSESPAPSCVEVSGESISAKQLLETAGFEIEGTASYGDQVVCRVNNLPSPEESFQVEGELPYVELCVEMPPAFAYWALWVKNSKDGNWEYAQTGVNALELKPGQAVGLVFSVAGETSTPN